MIKPLLMWALFTVTLNAVAEDYSGVWQDKQGQIYSIHQNDDSLLMAKLIKNKHNLSPYEQGNLYVTNESLDLAISGSGFFTVVNSDGSHAYTREGAFAISTHSTIVDKEGRTLLTTQGRPIPENTRQIIVSEDGEISVQLNGSEIAYFHDQIKLAWIPQSAIRFSGYPITSVDAKQVTFFKPGEPQELHFGASIMQGMKEGIEYEERTWQAYHGIIDGRVATIVPMEDEQSPRSLKLLFQDENNAIVIHEDNNGFEDFYPYQDVNTAQNGGLIQFLSLSQRNVEGPLTKIY